MKYEIRLGREVVNTILHILAGGLIAYIFVPTYTLWVILGVLAGLSILREVFQFLRGKYQPLWIHTIDVLGFLTGGCLWYMIRETFNIYADKL